jgi:hypothetical protein
VIFRVLDIETIPDFSVWTPGEDQYKLAPAATINPTLYEAGVCPVEPFPPPHACRVVALSTVDIILDITNSPRYRFDSAATSCSWNWCPPFDRE